MVHNSIVILHKPHVWKKNIVFQLWPKTLSASVPVLFDHQYLWKESSNLLDFLHGENHQGKVPSETTFFGWVLPVVLLIESDFIIL